MGTARLDGRPPIPPTARARPHLSLPPSHTLTLHFNPRARPAPQRDAAALFTHLCAKYAPSTARDATFAGMLTTIGQRFFNIAPPRGGMEKMMEGMMGMLGGGGGGGGGPGGNPLAALMAGMGGGGGGGPGGNPLAALMAGMNNAQGRR